MPPATRTAADQSRGELDKNADGELAGHARASRHLAIWAQNRLDDLKTTELAMYAYDEGTGVDRRSRLLVATELGLLDAVEAVTQPEKAGSGPDVWKLTGDLHPWSVVRGAHLSYSQKGGRQAPQLHSVPRASGGRPNHDVAG